MTNSSSEQPLFVTFEGGEGAGKTTLMRGLAERLRTQGRQVVLTREPGGSRLGKEVRRLLLETDHDYAIGERAELLLFLADRAQHVEELINPSLGEGKIVFCDRFVDSSVAYQGYGRGLDVSEIRNYCSLATGGRMPDVTLLLDLSPEVGLKRAQGAHSEEAAVGSTDRLEAEALSFHQRVRDGFLAIAGDEPDRVAVLDAMQTPEALLDHAWKLLLKRLDKHL